MVMLMNSRDAIKEIRQNISPQSLDELAVQCEVRAFTTCSSRENYTKMIEAKINQLKGEAAKARTIAAAAQRSEPPRVWIQ